MDESRSDSDVGASGPSALSIGDYVPFADAGNLEHCTKYLNEKLVAFGLPAPLDLFASDPISIARTCNCIYSLLQQKQRDIEFRESSNEQRQRLQCDISRSEAKVEILEAQLASKDRELATLTRMEATTSVAFKTQIEKLQQERNEFQRVVIGNQQKNEMENQVEYIQLQERLNQVLMDKKKESGSGLEMMNLLQKGCLSRTSNGKKSESDFYKRIVDACELKQRELMAENVDLWALLRLLQMDMHDLLNAPIELSQQILFATEREDAESLQSPLGGKTDVFDLLCSMAKDQIKESLQIKMASIKEWMGQFQDSQKGAEVTSEATERELGSISEKQAGKNRIENSETQEIGGKYLEATENEKKGIEYARIEDAQIEDPRSEDMEHNMDVDTTDYVDAQGSELIMVEDQSQCCLSEQFEVITENKTETEKHDHTEFFTTDKIFESRDLLKQWADELGRIHGSVLVISKSDHSHSGRTPRLQIGCERGGKYRKHKKGESPQTESEDTLVKKRKIGSKKCECPFLLKGNHVTGTVDKWRVWVECGFHNHPLETNLEGHSYAGRLSNDEMTLVAEMTKSGVKPQKILNVIKEMNPQNVSTARHIYNARAKIRSSSDLGGRLCMDHLLEIVPGDASTNNAADVIESIDNDAES